MKAIILTAVEYKEKDGILTCLSEGKCFSVTVKGMFDPKSKFAYLNYPMLVVDLELNDDGRYKYPVLKNCSITFNPNKVKPEYEDLVGISFLSEATKKLLQDEEKATVYPILLNAIYALKNRDDLWQTLLIYLANCMKIAGFEFEVNRCVFCGSKIDIARFSFADGGFVCRNCLDEGTELADLNHEQLMLLRDSFIVTTFDIVLKNCTRDNALAILNCLRSYIIDQIGVDMTSIGLLNR